MASQGHVGRTGLLAYEGSREREVMMVSKVYLATTEIMEWTADLDPRDLLETLDCQAEMVSMA